MSTSAVDTSQRALQIIGLSQKFPADPILAEAHYHSKWFSPEMFFRCSRCGTNFGYNVHVCTKCGLNLEKEVYHCTCCRHKIKQLQYDFCIDSSNPVLSPDIVVFFTFVKLILVYFVFRFMVLDLYTIYYNWRWNSCRYLDDPVNCPKTFVTRLATLRRLEDKNSLFVFDLVNLAFVVISLIYLLCCQNYLNSVYLTVANTIQTEDDFSIYVYNVPVLLDNEQSTTQIGYRPALTSYFEQSVRNWITQKTQNPEKQDYLFKDYLKVAQARGDDPANPSKIVTSITLCYDLEELVNIRKQKRRIMRAFQRSIAENKQSKKGLQSWALDEETQSKLQALDIAEVNVTEKYVEENSTTTFLIGRFIGKAFISFQYQHFAQAVVVTANQNQKFSDLKEIQVQNAASPTDINWGNLNIAQSQRRQRTLTTYLLTAGCIAVGFAVVLALRYAFKRYYKIDDYDTKAGLLIVAGSTSVTVLIIAINHIIKYVVKLLTEYEEHETRTTEEESLLIKLLIASFFNIVLSTLVVWMFMRVGVWDRNGLAVQIVVIMIAAMLIEILLSIVDWRWIWRWITLKRKYRAGQPILEFQFVYNQQYELPSFQLSQRYNYYLWQSYFLAFYSYLVPASSVIGLIGVAVQFFLDRINLLRRSSFHPNYSFSLARTAVRLLQTTVSIHAVGNFVSGWLVKGTWYQPINIISLMITIVFNIFIWGIVGTKRHPCFYTTALYENLTYTQCQKQGKFYHSYQSENPATRNRDFQQMEEKYYGIDSTTMNNSLMMSPTPVVGSFPQMGSQGYRNLV